MKEDNTGPKKIKGDNYVR